MVEEKKTAEKPGVLGERVPPSKRAEKEQELAQIAKPKTGLFSSAGWFTLLTIVILEGVIVAGITLFLSKRSPSAEDINKTPPVYLNIDNIEFQVRGSMPESPKRVKMNISLVINKRKGNEDELREFLSYRIPYIQSFILEAMAELEPNIFYEESQDRNPTVASKILARLNSEYPEYIEQVLVTNLQVR